MHFLRKTLLLATLHLGVLGAPLPENRFDETDLATFVTRPDIRPPTFDIVVHDSDAVTPGFWFVNPYVDLKTRMPSSAFSPGQVGPHIYDSKGNLVYSGAHLADDRTSFDFKAVTINGSDHLSLILDHDNTKSKFTAGAGIVLNSNFQMVSSVQNMRGTRLMNMHEFNVVDGGQSGLTITYEPQMYDYSHGLGQGPFGWIGNNGFQEVNLVTGELTFEWWALDHIDPSESTVRGRDDSGTWDWFHMNSVDKNEDGDYLVSARYTDAIYKISGKDGSVLWRLGGKKSSFALDGFRFSRQHDARFRREDDGTTVISFLNNGADFHVKSTNTSSAMVVALNTMNMEASLVQKFDRPDGQLTKLRGNAQELSNGNYFVCWSENGHISEHTAQGKLAMEAQFSSRRFVTYRASKFNFTATPPWPPVSKAFAYGVTPDESTIAVYVSWNGATEVASWKFWGSSQEQPFDDYDLLGNVTKGGFEDLFMMSGFVPYVFAEALDAKGQSLGLSPVSKSIVPGTWSSSETEAKAKEMQKARVSQLDVNEYEEEERPLHATRFFSNLDERLMKSKRAATVAIYLWLWSCFFAMTLALVRICRRKRKQPWLKAEM